MKGRGKGRCYGRSSAQFGGHELGHPVSDAFLAWDAVSDVPRDDHRLLELARQLCSQLVVDERRIVQSMLGSDVVEEPLADLGGHPVEHT